MIDYKYSRVAYRTLFATQLCCHFVDLKNVGATRPMLMQTKFLKFAKIIKIFKKAEEITFFTANVGNILMGEEATLVPLFR